MVARSGLLVAPDAAGIFQIPPLRSFIPITASTTSMSHIARTPSR